MIQNTLRCPTCGSVNIEVIDYSEHGKCIKCETEFSLLTDKIFSAPAKTDNSPTKEVIMHEKLTHDLLTSKYTEVYHEPKDQMQFGAPHCFTVLTANGDGSATPLAEIHFQEGPIKEAGVNGVCNEDLIAMVICRLEHFQKGPFACRDNAVAITKLEEALLWLRKRTIAREARGVEGTNRI